MVENFDAVRVEQTLLLSLKTTNGFLRLPSNQQTLSAKQFSLRVFVEIKGADATGGPKDVQSHRFVLLARQQ